MRSDSVKLIASYVAALGIIAFTCYALVLHPFIVETDVKLWLTGAAGGALAFLFGDQVATRSKIDQQSAFTQGIASQPTTSTQTISSTDSATSATTTTAPSEIDND